MKVSTLTVSLLSAGLMGLSMVQASAADLNPTWKHDLASVRHDNHALIQLVPGGKAQSVKLTGINNIQYFEFGVRSDELVSEGSLDLDFTSSPSLIPNYSQVNVYLNEQLQQSIPLNSEMLGSPSRVKVALEPKLLKATNRLSIEFIGHYQTICENPTNPVLWVSINPSSRLSLTKQKIRLGNDLSRFPAPFINTTMNELTVLPFVFAKTPSDTVKTAAAVLASYGGELTQWRGIDYPVYFNEVPADRHFVVFATNEQRPDFLKNLPPANGPQVLVTDAPNSRFAKMLVVMGRHDEDLLVAAKAFASPDNILIGEQFQVKNFKDTPTRQAYDAPQWISTNEPITFAQLMQYPQQLTVRGQQMMPVHLPVRLAPDLYMAGSANMTMALKYRYSQPIKGDSAQLQVRLNDRLLDSINLSSETSRATIDVELPAFEGPLANTSTPSSSLGAVNDFSFQIQYHSYHSEGALNNCKSVTLISHQMEIEPTSNIELSGLYHYAKLPNLNLFTQSGFPFSKYADLSETTVLMPLAATTTELNTLLNSVARIAATTGLAGTKVTVSSDVNPRSLVHKDILLIGEMPLGLMDFEVKDATALQQKVHDHVHQNKLNDKSLRTLLNEQRAINADGGLASIVSLQSPFNKDRTIVALVNEGENGHQLLNNQLRYPTTLANAHGSVCVLTPNDQLCFESGSSYYVGSIPWYHKIWTTIGQYPLILAFCAIICASLLGFGILRFMRRWIKGRA